MNITTQLRNGEMVDTGRLKYPDTSLRTALHDFVQRPMDYREQYLQKHFDAAYDGYSYWGQKHSRNQYPDDMLHSFVVSEFSPPHRFPAEFQPFLGDEWIRLRADIRALELEVIGQLELPGLAELYGDVMGHMISCNYYPAVEGAKRTARGNTRLSEHKDVSLFTVFLFGIEDGLSYRNGTGEQVQLGTRNNVVLFPGYMMEVLTGGKIRAVEHQVDLPEDSTIERFSFAFFSMPRPETRITFGSVDMSAEEYYEQYLALF